MTRKKFVKQLMGLGVSRNGANLYAKICRRKGIPYAQRYKAMEPGLRLRKTAKNVSVTINASVAKFASNLAVAAANMAKLRESIAQVAQQPLVAHHPTPYTPGNLPGLLPDNMQIMRQADHAALHGRACGIDLAAGPDMTAYMHLGGGQE